MGGYGETPGAPFCQPLGYFTGSPKRLDVENELRYANSADLTYEVKASELGAVNGRRIYSVTHTVQSPDLKKAKPELFLIIKILLVERHPKEFCDIYQYQKTEAHMFLESEVHDARIISVNSRRVMKSIDQDMKTAAIEYWAVDGEEPVLLNTEAVSSTIRDSAPKGGEWNWELNIQSTLLKVNVWEGNVALGTVELDLDVQGNKLIASTKRWVPSAGH